MLTLPLNAKVDGFQKHQTRSQYSQKENVALSVASFGMCVRGKPFKQIKKLNIDVHSMTVFKERKRARV